VDKAFLSFVGGKVSIEHQFESEGGTVVAIAYAEPAAASSTARVDPAVTALVRAVDQVLESDLVGLPDAVVLERQRVMLVQVERLRTAALMGLRTIDSRDIYMDDGAGSASGWLRAQAVADDRLSVHTARRLDGMPVAGAEACAGRLSVQDLHTIASALARVPVKVDEDLLQAVIRDGVTHVLAGAFGGDAVENAEARLELDRIAVEGTGAHQRLEQAFVLIAQAMAERLPGSSLRVALADLVDALMPVEHDERAARKHSVRHLVLRPVFDGGWHLRGFLDDDTGALLRSSLDRFAPAVAEEVQPGAELPSREQRDHDAFHAALQQVAAGRSLIEEASALDPAGTDTAPNAIEPSRRGCSLTLTAQVEALLGMPGALPAQLGDLMRIAPATLERLACDSEITGILVDRGGRPVHVGRARRHATRTQRLALATQWGGLCAVAGCGRPGTIPHHVRWWRHGGNTDLHNLVPLCHQSHHDVHTGRKTLRLRDGRWIGPGGWADGPSP